jgi:hypothetical protein
MGLNKVSTKLNGRDFVKQDKNCHNRKFQVLLTMAERKFIVVALPGSYELHVSNITRMTGNIASIYEMQNSFLRKTTCRNEHY